MAVFARGARSRAQGVCGDGAVDSGEQCDDGNLVNGDGCSSNCQKEICGNGVIDEGEQCDDGSKNGTGGDSCSSNCFIRFCGDGVIDYDRDEQCDDGSKNAAAGPCTRKCQLTEQKQSSSSASSQSRSEPKLENKIEEIKSSEEGGGNKAYWLLKQAVPETSSSSSSSAAPVEPAIQTQAKAAAQFMNAPAGEDFKQYFSREENLALEGIVSKLTSGRRLNKEERVQAQELSTKFLESKFTERDKYLTLLKDFIATPVSSKVVADQKLSTEKLITPDVATAILELSKTSQILSPESIKREVVATVDRLKQHGIDIEAEMAPGYSENLTEKAMPVQVFTTIKNIKEAAEKRATLDPATSLLKLKQQAQILKQSAPVLEREYGIAPSEIDALLKSLNVSIKHAGKDNLSRVTTSVDRIVSLLETRKVVTRAELAMETIESPHAAAAVKIAENAGWRSKLTASVDVPSLVADLTEAAPKKYKTSFSDGTIEEQKKALIDFLNTNSRLTDLLVVLRNEGQSDMDRKFYDLKKQILDVGSENPSSPCSSSMINAMACTDDFMKEVEASVRKHNKFTNFIGTLQDLFGIGS